jgi:hypothetical protein
MMNGLDKIKLGRRFDDLSDEQKEELYNKYGEDVVNDEVERCLLAGLIHDDDNLTSINAQSLVNLFTSDEIEKYSNDIMEDIERMLGE